MASIIKNQLVKHLSKFARNLKPEQISLDVLKGKSELRNIELNEEVLTEVLELPPWMRIKKAHCNRVAIRVPWTRLKTAPVELFIDEIQVQIVLSADKSPTKSKNPLSGYDTGSYGFADKIVEGMSLYVNTLEIHFDSGVFGGSFMLSRLSVESKTPGWQSANDLRKTRLSCPTSNRTLLYKQVSWQLLRIEASAQTDSQQRRNINAPLRLITSHGKIRISLKKNSTDGSVIHARIMMILEDILWVATLPQVRSAIAFYSHIMKLVNDAQKDSPPVIPVPARTPQTLAPDPHIQTSSSTFRKLDFEQTSYHLQVKKIDLHLCDDQQGSSGYPEGWDIQSGAVQVTLHVLLIDVYPKTLATSDRSHWVRYTSPNTATGWMSTNLRHHLAKMCEDLDDTTRMRLARSWPDLMSFNVVMRIYDLVVQCVSDMYTKKDEMQIMFQSDRNLKKSLPSDQYIFHAEFANFFHPLSDSLPVPPPATYLQLGPFSLLFHKRTLRWCLFVIQNITTALQEADARSTEPMPQADLRVDLLMPKVIVNLADSSSDNRLPRRLLVSFSTVTLCNNPFDASTPHFQNICSSLVDYVTDADLDEGKPMFRSDFIQMNNRATAIGLNEGEQWWLWTSPMWVDTDHGEHSRTIPLVSDVSFYGSFSVRPDQINAYIEPQTAINVLLDHFQFLQLTRLSEELSEFADVLSADAKFFAAGKEGTAATVVLLASINKVRVHLLLTQGPLPSPYETIPTTFSQFAEDNLSETRSMTPISSPIPATLIDEPVKNSENSSQLYPRQNIVLPEVEEFKEFPGVSSASDLDLVSNMDETMSVTTDLSDDDASFVAVDIQAEDDLLPNTEFGEEATFVDDVIENDIYYKSMMAKQVNVLMASLEDIAVLANVFKGNMKIHGRACRLSLEQELHKLRSDVYATVRSTLVSKEAVQPSNTDPHSTFLVSSPANSPVTSVTLNVNGVILKLHDEIIAHLGAFVLNDQPSVNKVCLRVNVHNSDISIHDPKKKKPLRLRIKECVIEQDED